MQEITGYLVEVANSDDTQWLEDTLNCDGANPSETECVIPMDVLQATDYSLALDQLVKVRVSA